MCVEDNNLSKKNCHSYVFNIIMGVGAGHALLCIGCLYVF